MTDHEVVVLVLVVAIPIACFLGLLIGLSAGKRIGADNERWRRSWELDEQVSGERYSHAFPAHPYLPGPFDLGGKEPPVIV